MISVTAKVMIAAVLLIGIFSSPASSARSCGGDFEATQLNPLPQPTKLSWSLTNPSAALAALSARFASALNEAGIGSGPAANAQLNMTFTLTLSAGANLGGPFINFTWADPTAWPSGQTPTIVGSTLDYSANVVDAVSAQTLWIANGHCTVQTDDNGLLAEELGRLIGRSMGRNVQRGGM